MKQDAGQSGGDNIMLAISAIVICVFALSLGDALIKKFSADFTLGQIFIIRSAIAIPVLVAVMKIPYRPAALGSGLVTIGCPNLRTFGAMNEMLAGTITFCLRPRVT